MRRGECDCLLTVRDAYFDGVGADGRPAHQEPESPVWMYPSEQMFYNAMRRKGWSPSEQDMQSVVAIHNGVNERAWSEVNCIAAMKHQSSCLQPYSCNSNCMT